MSKQAIVFDTAEHLMGWLNSLDTSEMTVKELRSSLYSKLLELRGDDVGKRCPLCGNVMQHTVTDGVFHNWLCLEPHTREQWNAYVKESGDSTTAEDQEDTAEGSRG